MTSDKFPQKVLSLFNNNLDKVRLSNEDKNATYQLNVFLPYKETKGGVLPDFTGYNLAFEVNMDRVKLTVKELKLKAAYQSIRWGVTENVVELLFFKESLIEKEKTFFYGEVQKFVEKFNDYLEEDKEKKTENIKKNLLKAKLSFDDPTITFIEKLYKEKEKKPFSEESFQQEPNIMFFGEEDDNTH